VAAVQLPHPGTSYNPDYDDHQDLLMQAHLAELKKLNDEQKLLRRLRENLKKKSWQEIEVLFMFIQEFLGWS
jgi:nucleolar protein 53